MQLIQGTLGLTTDVEETTISLQLLKYTQARDIEDNQNILATLIDVLAIELEKIGISTPRAIIKAQE